jgi:hypothetical protein
MTSLNDDQPGEMAHSSKSSMNVCAAVSGRVPAPSQMLGGPGGPLSIAPPLLLLLLLLLLPPLPLLLLPPVTPPLPLPLPLLAPAKLPLLVLPLAVVAPLLPPLPPPSLPASPTPSMELNDEGTFPEQARTAQGAATRSRAIATR